MEEKSGVTLNVLAERYASPQMIEIWSHNKKIQLERSLWISVMKEQAKLGLEIPESAINDYEKVKDSIDLASIRTREFKLKHDVKARIEEFNCLAGQQFLHIGMTSRDLTENIEAVQIKKALYLIRAKSVAYLTHLNQKILEFKSLPIIGRTHNVPAQITTLGKRFASLGEEFLYAFKKLEHLLESFPIRGFKGAVGTAQDSLDLLGIDHNLFEIEVIKSLDFKIILDSTGQIYPRSIDFDVISTLLLLSASPSNMAILIRLMSGQNLVSEGFKKSQVGSSAMPHKRNAVSCERLNGLSTILKSYVTMIGGLLGEQWNEGDVSDSVVRRLALPDSFYCLDAVLEIATQVLRDLEVSHEDISKEIEKYLPFIASSKLLTTAVKAGIGREDAYNTLRRIYNEVSIKTTHKTLIIELLDNYPNLKFNVKELEELFTNPLSFVGLAEEQCEKVSQRIDTALKVTLN